MSSLREIAPAFMDMAHQIVWASVSTVSPEGRPRSRVLHPLWQWDGDKLVGWVATAPTPLKRSHLDAHPHVSVNYWAASHDTCLAECHAELLLDLQTREMVWNLFADTPEPVGYDPSMIPGWDSPNSEDFAALRLEPWLLRVMPGTFLGGGQGELLTWRR